MATEHMTMEGTSQGAERSILKRRGLVAGAAAVVAGLMAKSIADTPKAAAANGDFVVAGAATHATRTTYLSGDAGFDTGGASSVIAADAGGTNTDVYGVSGYGSGNRDGIYGTGGNNNGAGVYGAGGGSGPGVHGVGTSGIGVFGESTSGPGVRGVSGPGGTEDGVRGIANGTGRGVSGFAGSGIGVQGNATGTGIAVEGLSTSGIAVNGQSNTGPGVRGTTAAGSSDDGGRFLADKGRGVAGFANSGLGVYGTATTGIGVYGVNTAGGGAPYGVVGATSGVGIGVYGVVNTAGAVAFAGGAGVNGAIAAQFSGPVNIYHTSGAITNGNLFIQGNYTAGGTKSAAVPHPDGSHRLLYCMESPEAWFEDFGEGTITAGKAEVKLDPDFAAVVDTGTLHVFPVAHDEHHLYIAGKSATGFTVASTPSASALATGKKATDLSGTFSYRVVAKRKDVKAERLAKFDLPKAITFPAPPAPSTLKKGT